MLKKLKTKEEIAKISQTLKDNGNAVVTANGSFDIIHAGHIRFLKEAKSQGDILIIGLNSDRSVRAYKGSERPIIPENERAEILDAIGYVDYIVLFDEPEIAVPLIRLVKPKVHCNGAEYGAECVETAAIKEVGARLHMIHEIKTSGQKNKVSTTSIINKIKNLG